MNFGVYKKGKNVASLCNIQSIECILFANAISLQSNRNDGCSLPLDYIDNDFENEFTKYFGFLAGLYYKFQGSKHQLIYIKSNLIWVFSNTYEYVDEK